MSMKRVAMRITLPGVINDFLHEMMEEYGFNKSDLLETMVFYISMPEHLEDFKSQYLLGDAGEDEEDEEDENEEDKPGLLERLFGSNEEEEEED